MIDLLLFTLETFYHFDCFLCDAFGQENEIFSSLYDDNKRSWCIFTSFVAMAFHKWAWHTNLARYVLRVMSFETLKMTFNIFYSRFCWLRAFTNNDDVDDTYQRMHCAQLVYAVTWIRCHSLLRYARLQCEENETF